MCVFLGSNVVSWFSKKQTTVSRSSTEAEYRVLASTAAECLWFQSLFSELQVKLPSAPTLWSDNVSAIALSANPILHARTKHVEIDLLFVHDKVLDGTLFVRYVPTLHQIADTLTKPLPLLRFSTLKD